MTGRTYLDRAAVYFGFRDDDAVTWETTDLARVRRGFVTSGTLYLVLAVVQALLLLVVLSAEAWKVLVGGVAGAAVCGAATYLAVIRPRLPTRPLGPPPLEALWEDPNPGWTRRAATWLLSILVGGIGLAWLADWLDLSGVFVPGQCAGYLAANAFGAVKIMRWEARNHSHVGFRVREGEIELFAVPAGGTAISGPG